MGIKFIAYKPLIEIDSSIYGSTIPTILFILVIAGGNAAATIPYIAVIESGLSYDYDIRPYLRLKYFSISLISIVKLAVPPNTKLVVFGESYTVVV